MLIVALFVVLPLSFSVFNTSQSLKEQYSLLDAFYTMNNGLPGGKKYFQNNADITIVDLSGVPDRPGVYHTLQRIMEAGPKLVGLDVWMEGRKGIPEEDSLATLLTGNPLIISPCELLKETASDATSFQQVRYPFYASPDTPGLAAVNIDLHGFSWNCRSFTPQLSCNDTTYSILGVVMSGILDPAARDEVMKHPDKPHYIQFARDGYQNLSATFILQDTLGIARRMLSGKIVLIGDTNDASDQYPTPTKIRMSGVEIHANILNSILSRNWPRAMGKIPAWILAFIGVFLLLPLLRLIRKNEWLSIFSGVIQALLIILLVFVSYWIFFRFNYYVNSIYLLLGIGFSGMAESLYRKITKK